MDIEKFFDRVNHDVLMQQLRQVVDDKRVRTLVGRYLRAGVMIQGVVQESEEGTPQGGPLSPLLANIYLDALDKELESRGLSHRAICRRLQHLCGQRNERATSVREHRWHGSKRSCG